MVSILVFSIITVNSGCDFKSDGDGGGVKHGTIKQKTVLCARDPGRVQRIQLLLLVKNKASAG